MKPLTLENIKEHHSVSLEGIIKGYRWSDVKSSFPFNLSWLSTIILFPMFLLGKKEMYDILSYLCGQVISIFPNLLGFNLGGYALIIGFGNTQLIESMTKKTNKNNTSIIQKLSSVFAFTLLLQSTAFCVCFFISIIMQLGFSTSIGLMADILNSTLVIIVSFLSTWGLTILVSVVKNIFTFGQTNHFYLSLQRIKKEQDEKRKKQITEEL